MSAMGTDKRENESKSRRAPKVADAVVQTAQGLFGLVGSGDIPGGGADWGNAEGKLICDIVSTVTSRGGAVRFGYSRDGGAYALGLYYGGQAKTVYCSPHESIDDLLQVWIDKYTELPETGGASPA